MIIIAFAIAGVAIGIVRARRREGETLDVLHYGAVHGIALGLLGFLVTIALDYAF